MTIKTMKVAMVTEAPNKTKQQIKQWLMDLNRTAVEITVGEGPELVDQWLIKNKCQEGEEVILFYDW